MKIGVLGSVLGVGILGVLASPVSAAPDGSAAPVLTVKRTIALGADRPRDLALTRDGATLLIATAAAQGGGGKLKVYSTATGRQLGRDLATGGDPVAVAVSPDGRYAYLSGIVPAARTARILLGKPEVDGGLTLKAPANVLAFSEDGKWAYLAGESQPRLDVVDVKWNQEEAQVAGIPKGLRRGVLVPGGRFLYLLAADGKLLKADLVANAVARTLAVEGGELAASADGARVYVSAGDWDTEIKVVLVEDDAVERVLDPELVTGSLAVGPEGKYLWVALPRNGKLGLLDLGTGRVVASLKTGKRPFKVLASPDGRTAWCASAAEGTVTVVEYAPPPVPKDEPVPAVQPAPVSDPEPVRGVDPSATRWTLAVADLEAQGIAASAAAIVTGWLRDELFKGEAYRVLERKAMESLMTEQALQQTGCTDADCAVKLGKMLNVQRMLLGTMGKFDDVYVLNLRLVDVENGALLWSESAKGRTIDEVETGVRKLARALSGAAR